MSKKIVYVCGVDWQHELGEAMGGNDFYPSVEDLKNNRSCWKSCGIIKIEMDESNATWVESQDFSKGETVSASEIDTPEYKAKQIKHIEGLISKTERSLERLKNYKDRLQEEEGQ